MAAAALAIAREERDAAVRELLLDRERTAMVAEDFRSHLAQRLFVGSLLVPSAIPPMTWEAAYWHRHNDLISAHDAMRAARRAVRQGDGERADGVLTAEVSSSEEEDEAPVCSFCDEAPTEGLLTMAAEGRPAWRWERA